ncbi:MAG: hypothetical protein UHK60_08360 [Acutalibacteraceae bacterium]|nr:hypothetical protein [Acutalibacteraceae bacterium]
MENNNKSIASRWSAKTQEPKQELTSVTNPIVVSPVDNNTNPVRHQYRQTILNGLKGESYV